HASRQPPPATARLMWSARGTSAPRPGARSWWWCPRSSCPPRTSVGMCWSCARMVSARAHTHARTHAHTHTHTHKETETHIHKHTHTHTQTFKAKCFLQVVWLDSFAKKGPTQCILGEQVQPCQSRKHIKHTNTLCACLYIVFNIMFKCPKTSLMLYS